MQVLCAVLTWTCCDRKRRLNSPQHQSNRYEHKREQLKNMLELNPVCYASRGTLFSRERTPPELVFAATPTATHVIKVHAMR